MKGLLAALRAQMDKVVTSNNDLQSQVAALRDQVEQCQVSVPAVPGVGAQPQTHVRKIIRPSSAASSHDDRDDCIASGRHTNAFCHPTLKGDFRRNTETDLQGFISHLQACYVNDDITDALYEKLEKHVGHSIYSSPSHPYVRALFINKLCAPRPWSSIW